MRWVLLVQVSTSSLIEQFLNMHNLENMHTNEDTSSWDGSPFDCKRNWREDCLSSWSSQLNSCLVKVGILYYKCWFMHMISLWRWLIWWDLYIMAGKEKAVLNKHRWVMLVYDKYMRVSLTPWRFIALWHASIDICWSGQTNKQGCDAFWDLRKRLGRYRPNDGMRLCVAQTEWLT